MDLAADVAAWHDFYLASAGASAVLLGLVFVSMTLHYDPRAADRGLVAMATESAVPFFYATVVSLVMLMPVSQPAVPTVALLLTGLLAGFNSGTPIFGRWFASGSGPRVAHPRAQRFKFFLPLLVAAALLPVAVALPFAPQPALYGVGLIVLLFLAFGMQNAWDALLRRDLRDAPDA
jgi:hypothetical protein